MSMGLCENSPNWQEPLIGEDTLGCADYDQADNQQKPTLLHELSFRLGQRNRLEPMGRITAAIPPSCQYMNVYHPVLAWGRLA